MINDFLSRLTNVKPKGEDSWVACCPAHEDRSPSLAVSCDREGKILLHCFAGCDVHSITASVGMNISDLFPPNTKYTREDYRRLENQANFRKKKQDERFNDRVMLDIYDSMRGRGEKLSPEQLKKERECYMRVRHANG